MSKPIINKINTFDALNDYSVTFSYVGNQPYKNRLVVINTMTNEIVLDETITNMKFSHTITASTLVNGISYTAQISVFDENDNESSLSDKAYFTCYTTPLFEFVDLSKTTVNTIKSAQYSVTLSYIQEQSRSLKNYQFYLYDASHKELKKSDLIYYSNNNAITYTYKNLDNNGVYYIRCVGETVDNATVDTGLYELLAVYSISNSYNNFYVTNNFKGGYIQCVTNIVSIEGITEDEIVIENGVADLSGKKLAYKEGFLIDGDYKIGLKIKNPIIGVLYESTNSLNKVILQYCKYEETNYFKLNVINGLTDYILYSDRIIISDDTFISVYITKKNNLYQLDVVTE